MRLVPLKGEPCQVSTTITGQTARAAKRPVASMVPIRHAVMPASSASAVGSATSMWVTPVGSLPHRRREGERARRCAGELSEHVGRNVRAPHAAERPEGRRDRRVEVRAGHGADEQDDHRQSGGGGQRVLQQLESDLPGGQLFGGDAGPDDDGDEQSGAERFGGEPSGQRGVVHRWCGLSCYAVTGTGLAGRRRCARSHAWAAIWTASHGLPSGGV